MNGRPDNHRRIDPTTPEGMAIVILSKLAAVDSTAPAVSEIVLRTWTELIAKSRLELADLEAGLMRVYSRGGDVPKNKLGAILQEAKQIRRDRLERVPPAPALPRGRGSGEPVRAAYEVNGAIGRTCPHCGARPRQWCTDADVVRKIPHLPRISHKNIN